MKQKLLFVCFAILFSLGASAQVMAYPPIDLSQCGNEVFDLTVETPLVLGDQDPAIFTVTYYLTQEDAVEGNNAIFNTASFVGQPQQTIFAKVTNTATLEYAVTTFQISWAVSIQLPEMTNVHVCDSYVLPAPPAGAMYYSQPGGVGDPIAPGNVITVSATQIYVYATNGICSDEESFMVMITDTPVLPQFSNISSCDSYTLPYIEVGYYFADPNYSVELPAGTVIAQSQMIYVRSFNLNGPVTCVAEASFYVNINTALDIVFSTSGSLSCGENPDPITIEVVSAQQNLTYLWSFNGVPILSETQGILSVTQPGIYSCTISNACGQVVNGSIGIGASLPVNIVSELVSCMDNGIAFFDLNAVTAQMLNGASPSEYEVLYYENEEDAQNQSANSISNLSTYTTTVASQIIYVRVTRLTADACFTIFPLYLNGQSCTGNTVSGIVRYSPDGNGCSEDDPRASNIQVALSLGNQVEYTYTNMDGEYTFYNVTEGVHQVYLTGLPAGYTLNSEPSYPVDVVGTNGSYTRDWCIKFPASITDAVVYLYPNMNARPGFPVSYTMFVFNNGTINLSGNASVNYDVSKLDFVDATPAITSQISNTLNFYITDLAPMDYKVFTLNFTVKMPPTVNSGDILSFDANMDTVALDATVADNVALLNQTVVNSLDPNDITVQQGAQILQNQAADYLNYTIHFQNIGTADAINVKVVNELDAKLDWSTFRPVASNHNFVTERVGNEITFRFDNINLPGSMQDEAGSNGYITYKVKPIANLAVGDIIPNAADIYFDFNAAIATNTVTTELVSLLNIKNPDFANLEMAPNPASEKVTIRFNESLSTDAMITLYDIQGKLILQHVSQSNATTSVDVSKLSPGMYFVKITTEGKAAVRKLMIK